MTSHKSRKTQVYTRVIQNFVEQYGRVPTEGELQHLARGSLFKPMTKPIVPKEGAVSSAAHFKSTLKGLLDDDYDLMELIKAQKDYIDQLSLAALARQKESADRIRESIRKVRMQSVMENARIAVPNTLPDPINKLSNNVVKAGGTISLTSDHSLPVGFSVIDITPFAEGAVNRSQLGDFSFPYVAIVEGERGSSYTGIQFQMLLDEDALVTRLHYEGSPGFMTIEVMSSGGPGWSKIVSMSVDGRDDIAISRTAIRLRITLTQALERSTLRITDLALFQERYAPRGTYATTPIELDDRGILEVDVDQYLPEGTDIHWQYAPDVPVSGDYVDNRGIPINLDSPNFEDSTFDSQVSGDLTFAQTVRYDLRESFRRPTWRDLQGPVYYNIESGNLPSYTGTVVDSPEGEFAPVVDIATIPVTALDDMVNVTYGKDAWLFRAGELEGIVIDEVGLRRLAMTGYPHWTTHLLVEDEFKLAVDDPNERIAYIILELEGNVLILKQPFQYVLVKGIWKCTLVMDENYVERQDDLSATHRAISYSGLDPRSAVNTVDRTGAQIRLWIQPFSVPLVSSRRIHTDPDYTDFQRAAIERRSDGKHVLVPDMSVDPTTMDMVSTAFDINSLSDIYVSSNLPLFYDITYLQEVSSTVKYVFLRAELSTSSKEVTPVIRNISLALNDVERKPPAVVERLKREGSINPLPE